MSLITNSNMTPEEYTKNGQNIPSKPKKGEPIVCQYCNEIIYPSQFSEDAYERKFEFKWHLHPWCKESMINQADRGTPGLLEERKKSSKQLEDQINELSNKNTKSKTGVVSKTTAQNLNVREFGQKIQRKK